MAATRGRAEARTLRLVDPDTGEITEQACPQCEYLQRQLDGAEKEIRAWRTRYANLVADKDREARQHELWPKAMGLFNYWRTLCGHPMAKFTPDRFRMLAPFLQRYGSELCHRAIEGAAYDPMTRVQKNGATKRYDDLELIFRDSGKFESFCNRAPRRR